MKQEVKRAGYILSLFSATLLFAQLTSCCNDNDDDDNDDNPPVSHTYDNDIICVNTISDVPPVTFVLSDDTLGEDIQFGFQTFYQTTSFTSTTGFFNANLFADFGSGLELVASDVVSVGDNKHYTFYAIGSAAQDNEDTFFTYDYYNDPPAGKSLVRFLNLSSTTTEIDALLINQISGDTVTFADRAYEGNLGLPMNDTKYQLIEVPSGDYQLQFFADGAGIPEVSTFIYAPDANAITIYALGFPGGSWPFHLHEGIVWH